MKLCIEVEIPTHIYSHSEAVILFVLLFIFICPPSRQNFNQYIYY